MLKILTYFNLVYGLSLFGLNYTKKDADYVTLILITIAIAFNWLVLKRLEGFKIVSEQILKVFRILSILTGSSFLIFNLIILLYFSGTNFSLLAFLVGIEIVFGLTIIAHAIKSFKL